MQKPERELIELKFKGVYQHQQANFDVVTSQLQTIIDHNEKQDKEDEKRRKAVDVRFDTVERETRFFRWIQKNPKASIILCVLIVSGFISIGTLIGWNTIINKLVI